MSKYKNIFLDLDGTILDSGPGIMKSVQYALDHFSLYHQPKEKLRRFIGPALTDSFMTVTGLVRKRRKRPYPITENAIRVKEFMMPCCTPG